MPNRCLVCGYARARERGCRSVIRTLIAERIALVRAGLVACLAREGDIEVVAELDHREPVLPAVSALRPDVAVLDDGLAGPDGYAIVQALHEAAPSCRTLIMAAQPRPCDLRRAVAAHATGFVCKDASPERIRQAIRQVAAGSKALDPDVAFAALDAPANPLTPREIDVLRLAAGGAPTADIARELSLAVGTVRNHISNVITKTGARNRVDAIRIADGCGWL
jgi:two-component system, NarL family, response regulator DesR